MFNINRRLTKDLFSNHKSILYSTGVYNKFEDLCIGRLRPNGHRSQPLFPTTLWNWFDAISYFDNLLLINTNIRQWNNMFRVKSTELV
jgi:hypothetical protein